MRCASRLRQNCCAADQAPQVNENGVKMHSWHYVRRQHIRMLRKQTKSIILIMAVMEAMRVGPLQMVYAGKQGYPLPGAEDYGVAYNLGYFLSWLYLCAIILVYVPLFSWWMPASTSTPETDRPSDYSSTMTRATKMLEQFNLILLPAAIGVYLLSQAYHLVQTFIYVDACAMVDNDKKKSWPANTRKNWLMRLLLLTGIAMSIGCGYFSLDILATYDLAHVKTVEYWVIVIPVQINFGVLLGSAMQWKVERKIERRRLAALANKAVEEGRVDEKMSLLEN